MDGQYLSVLMEGGELPPRDHFTIGYADHVWARDDRYLMFSRKDRSEPHLYDLQNDPETKNDLAGQDPEPRQAHVRRLRARGRRRFPGWLAPRRAGLFVPAKTPIISCRERGQEPKTG
jgi:hypothetical protein